MNKTKEHDHLRIQLLSQQLQLHQQQLQQLEQQLEELHMLEESLESLKSVGNNTELFANIGGGIYAQGKLSQTDKVFITVGAGVLVPKNIDEAKEIISKQLQDLEQVQVQLQQNLNTILREIQQHDKELS